MLPLISPANIDFVKRKSNTPPSDFSFFYRDLTFFITAVANTWRTFPSKPRKIPLLVKCAVLCHPEHLYAILKALLGITHIPCHPERLPVILSGAKDLSAYRCFTSFSMTLEGST